MREQLACCFSFGQQQSIHIAFTFLHKYKAGMNASTHYVNAIGASLSFLCL